MNLKNLTDLQLHDSGLRSVEKEREATTAVLYHLMEINRRRLFSSMGYKSLHEYAEKEYKYPGHQAYRRIAAMKLLKELPELEKKIAGGELSITHLSDAKKLFNRKACTRTEKLQLFEQLSNTTTREAQKIIIQISPEIAAQEKVKLVSENTVEFRFTGTITLEEKLKELKYRLAHTDPSISMGELIEKLADQYLELLNVKHEPKHDLMLNAKNRINSKTKNNMHKSLAAIEKVPTNLNLNLKTTSMSKAEILRQVWHRDQYRCGKCQSTYALEVDHKFPKAKGGQDTLENLRILCRNCNQRSAIEHYGLSKMQNYLESPEIQYRRV